MATKVIMPRLGLTMTEGTVIEWKKKEGDWVEKGEILYVLETEKVTFEVEVPVSGVLGKIIAKVGDVVPVGGGVAYILQRGEELTEILEPAIRKEEVAARTPAVEENERPSQRPVVSRDILASPLAKRLAEEHGIDLSTIKGTGPGGRIIKEDVLRVMEERKTAVKPTEIGARPDMIAEQEKVVPLTSMRKTIARRMVESFQSAPHFYLTVEVDTQELSKVREQLMASIERQTGLRLTYTDLLIKIVARALEDCPEINCAYSDGGIRLFSRMDIGLVVAVEGGLIVPVIRQANQKPLSEIAQARAQLTEKARERKLALEEITGSTFTISNLGMFGIDQFSAIIQPPEGAILAVGRIIDKPVAIERQVVIRPMMTLTLSIDHRVLDGVSGSRFLQRVKELIEAPVLLVA